MSVKNFAELCRKNMALLMAKAADENTPDDEKARARRQYMIWKKYFTRATRRGVTE